MQRLVGAQLYIITKLNSYWKRKCKDVEDEYDEQAQGNGVSPTKALCAITQWGEKYCIMYSVSDHHDCLMGTYAPKYEFQ